MAITFTDLHTEPGLKSLDGHLSAKKYISGDLITKDDIKVYAAVLKQPSSDLYPNASQWYGSVSSHLASSFPGKAVGVRIGADAAAEAFTAKMVGEGSSKRLDYNSNLSHQIWYLDGASHQRLVFDPVADPTRPCTCQGIYSYPNRVVHQIERERDLLSRDLYQERFNSQEHIHFLDSYLALAYENDKLKDQVKRLQERLDMVMGVVRDFYMTVVHAETRFEVGETRELDGSVHNRQLPDRLVRDGTDNDPNMDPTDPELAPGDQV